MIDTTHIDIKAVIDQLCCIRWQKPVKAHGELVYKGGPCPFCHRGTDRFALFVESEKPHFYCGIHGTGCGAHGDVIQFVQQLNGYKFASQAIRCLREMGYIVGNESGVPYSTSQSREYLPDFGPPSQKWQDQGNMVMHAAQKYLWSDIGIPARKYLHERGLKDETIKYFQLGCWPKWHATDRTSWGFTDNDKSLWLRPAILIPCYEESTLWSINQRLTKYTPDEQKRIAQGKKLPRYRKIQGSRNGLFHVDAIQYEKPVFMTEGEIDAMTLYQETGLPVVATTSTAGAQMPQWAGSLALASYIFVAFDRDDGKGDSGANYWMSLFEDKAVRWTPWAKDVNAMLLEGHDIATWANMVIELVTFSPDESPAQDNRQLSRDEIIARFAAIFPNCKVSVDPIGFSIDDRVKQFQEEWLAKLRQQIRATPWSGNSGGLTEKQWKSIPKGKILQQIINGEYQL